MKKAYELSRTIKGVKFEGVEIFESAEVCRMVAKELRGEGIPARCITLPPCDMFAGSGQWVGGRTLDRPTLFVPVTLSGEQWQRACDLAFLLRDARGKGCATHK